MVQYLGINVAYSKVQSAMVVLHTISKLSINNSIFILFYAEDIILATMPRGIERTAVLTQYTSTQPSRFIPVLEGMAASR